MDKETKTVAGCLAIIALMAGTWLAAHASHFESNTARGTIVAVIGVLAVTYLPLVLAGEVE